LCRTRATTVPTLTAGCGASSSENVTLFGGERFAFAAAAAADAVLLAGSSV
jgi:hypothetical protein